MVPGCQLCESGMTRRAKISEWPLVFCEACQQCDSIFHNKYYYYCAHCSEGDGKEENQYILCPGCIGEPNDERGSLWVSSEKFQRMCINPFAAMPDWSKSLDEGNELLQKLALKDKAAFAGLMKI